MWSFVWILIYSYKSTKLKLIDVQRLINAGYYENNKEILQKLNMDKYYANKEIIL